MEKIRKTLKILVRKPPGKWAREKPWGKLEENIKMALEK
jgi:hypothetical protein